MVYLDVILRTAVENLALEESLLSRAELDNAQNETLRFWEWSQPIVIVGAGCRLAADVDETACLADGVQLLRRSSGGGTVLLGPGCLCYSLVLSYDRSPALEFVRSSYAHILNRIGEAISEVIPGVEYSGISDLALAGLKFSGNAQQRKRKYLLHHGTLLYNFDLSLVGRYLRMPTRQPEYRRGRDHAEFLTNLPIGVSELKRLLRTAWNADAESTEWPQQLVHQLVTEKYSKEEWIRRR